MNEYSFIKLIVAPTITEDPHFERETAGEGKSMRNALRGYGIVLLFLAAVAWGPAVAGVEAVIAFLR